MLLTPGQSFAGYVVDRPLGHGGMGSVYAARHPEFGDVALKLVGQSASRERFQLEAQALQKLRHPGIARFLEAGWEPWPFLAQERVDGVSLQKLLEEGVERPVEFIMSLLDALGYLHTSGFVHRDLNPSNLLLRDQTVVLIDFGVAFALEEEHHLTGSCEILGTPEYMAPEQIDPAFGPISPQTDLFVVGTLLYRMLRGQLPFSGSRPRLLMQVAAATSPEPTGLPPELAEVCRRAWARRPQDRFESAAEFRLGLLSWIGNQEPGRGVMKP